MRKFMNIDGGDENGSGSQEEIPVEQPVTNQPQTDAPATDVPAETSATETEEKQA